MLGVTASLSPLTVGRTLLITIFAPLAAGMALRRFAMLSAAGYRGRVGGEAFARDLFACFSDPDGVDGRVWEALRSILGLDARRLVSPQRASFGAYYLRVTEQAAPSAAPMAKAATQWRGAEADPVDLLFRGTGIR